jgi:hypothetical protein
MSLEIEQEMIIMRALAARAQNVTEAGYVIPCPMEFVDKADFWAAVDPKITQKAIETNDVAFCMLSILKEDDDPSAGCDDNPLIYLTVNFYLFREYSAERKDETDTPDAFLKKVLKNYLLFRAAWRNLKNQFQGLQPIPDLPDGVVVNSNSLTQSAFADYKATCAVIPQIKGYSVNLQSKIEVIITYE